MISPSMSDLFLSDWRMKEFTWMWRDPVSENQFQTSIEELVMEKPIQILMHVQDFTNQTRRLLEQAIQSGNTTIIRCDDITSNSDLEKTKQLVEFAIDNEVKLLLAVIPAFKRLTQNLFFSFVFKATWVLFLGSFVFPLTVMMPWALTFKMKKKRPRWQTGRLFSISQGITTLRISTSSSSTCTASRKWDPQTRSN